MTQTYLGWDDNEYPWPPPDGWYQAGDAKWWPEGYGPGPVAAPAPPMENVGGFVAPPPAAGPPPAVAAPPPGMSAPDPYAAPGAAAPAPSPFGAPDPFAAPAPAPAGFDPTPPASSGGGGSGSKVLLILGGLLALLLIAGGGVFALLRGGDDDPVVVQTNSGSSTTVASGEGDDNTATSVAEGTETNDSTPAPAGGDGSAGTFENPHKFGDPVTISFEDFEGVKRSWIVEVVEPARDGTADIMEENQFNNPPADGDVFAVARLKITYESGPAPGSINELNLKAVGPSAVVLTWFGNYCGVVPDSLETSSELFPGGSTEGNICWATDSGDIGNLTMLIDSFVADGEVYLSLQ